TDRSSSPASLPSSSSTLASNTGAGGAEGHAAPATLVTFRLRPSNAVLVVDGVRLPEGVNAVQRPTDGHALRIVVHADRYEDSVELVEQSTPAVLDVVLTPRGGTRSPKRPRSAPSADAEAAMPNPYE